MQNIDKLYTSEEILEMLDGLEEDDIQYSIMTKKTSASV